MMRADSLRWHDYGGYTEMPALSSIFSYEHKGIKTHHRARNFIAKLLLKQVRIKTKHNQRKFIAELFGRRGKIMFCREQKNHNALLYNKKTQIMRLHMMCFKFLFV